MKLKTRVFELCNGKHRNLVELAQAIGATKAFPGYKLDDLFYVSED